MMSTTLNNRWNRLISQCQQSLSTEEPPPVAKLMLLLRSMRLLMIQGGRPTRISKRCQFSQLSGIRVASINAQSVANKSATISNCIQVRHLDFFCVVETWHDGADSPSLISCTPQEYKFIEKTRPRTDRASLLVNSNHGGICVFYRNNFHVQAINLPHYHSFEILALSVNSTLLTTSLITVYRPGSQAVSSVFFDEFADLLERCSYYSQCIIVGDINIHLDCASSTYCQQFKSLLNDCGMADCVNQPTHQHNHQLDVFITRSDKPPTSIIVDPPNMLSDHSLIVATYNITATSPSTVRPKILRRKWRSLDVNKFADDLQSSNLINSPPDDDVDGFFKCYNDTLTGLLDKHAPTVLVTRYCRPCSSWFDTECHLMKVKTRKLERIHRTNPSPVSRSAWQSQFRRQRFLYQSKYNKYWKFIIDSNAGNSKSLWNKLRCLLQLPADDDALMVHSADEFADFFTQKVDNIRHSTASAPPPVIPNRPVSSELNEFRQVTAAEVGQLLKRTANKQSSVDPIPTWLLKRLSPLLSQSIADMCNASFRHQTFPSAHKTAIVHPLLKKSTLDPSELTSYRPISSLSVISKTIERLVNNRLSAHMDTHTLLPSTQSAYRNKHSTETALVRIHNDIVSAIDHGQVAALVLLDLSAAFDTVDHCVLINVLEHRFGVTGGALNWMKSYLENRSQIIQLGSAKSSKHNLDCGVPQGSVLGPKQFIAYVEDVNQVFTDHDIAYHGYADDMQGLRRCYLTDAASISSTHKATLDDVQEWCSSRRLQLNALKTELIWFGSSANLRHLQLTDSQINIDSSTTIKPSNVIRDLGVYFDSELTMRSHIMNVTRSCYYQLRRLRSIRRHLGRDVTHRLVCAFVLSRLDYCNALFAGLPVSTLAPLQRVQNAAARLVLGLKWSEHITPALKQLHWLPIKQRICYKLSTIVHKCLHQQAPDYLTELFTFTADIQSRCSLRSASDGKLAVPRTRIQFGDRAFSVAGARQWNALPVELRNIDDFRLFKAKLKTHLFKLTYF